MENDADKAHPPLFTRHARRPRLTRLLDESRAQALVVTGPAGFGKTTLATEWLQGREQVVWYRATSASADVAAFSAGLADVVAPLVPGAGEKLKQRLRVADSPERAARPLAELLANDLEEWPPTALLVIDDYHLVADSAPVEDFFDWLLTLQPKLRVLVTTRRRPRWASARRILYGEITEIGGDQLAMTAEEARRVLGADRSSESVRELVMQAEGWPALIGLAALTASSEMPDERVSEALYRYFAEEVVKHEPPDVQRFMLLASVPATIDARVAREVLDVADPEPLLDALAGQGLLQRIDAAFQFHPLLRSFLRRSHAELDPPIFRALNERAIADSREHSRWEQAFSLALEAEEIEQGVEILVEATPAFLASGRIETLDRWLDDCGSHAFHSAGATIARVEILIRKGQLLHASAVAQDLAARLPDEDALASRANFLAGQALYLASGSNEAIEFQRRARELARDENDLKRSLWGLFMTENELGAQGAETHLAELELMAAESDDLDARLRVAVGRQAAAANGGSFGDLLEKSLPLVPLSAHAADPMARTTFLVNASYLCVAHADYQSALKLANAALEECRLLGLQFAKGYCLATIALANAGLRAFRGANQALRELETVAEEQDNLYLRWSAEITAIRVALARGRPDEAVSGRAFDFADEIPVPAAQGEYLGLLALAAAVSGDRENADRCSQLAQSRTTAIEARFFGQFADLISRIAIERASQSDVIGLVRAAISASFEDSFVLTYRLAPHILDFVPADDAVVPAVVLLMKRANDLGVARSRFPRASPVPPRSPLTPREEEVLELLGTGLSNAEIAERLFISRSTAKVHVQHILKKLGAKTRLQAAMHASPVSDGRD
jgi:ATP/maltotriose-dependent transcriptional regulator MalT